MKSIEFHNSPNILINAGIIALYIYLKKFKQETEIEYNFNLSENSLMVESDNLFQLLENVYYFMAYELYDTSTSKQLKKYTNAYYNVDSDTFVKFPKMTTFGLAALITNNKAGKTRTAENTKKKKNLLETNPNFMKKVSDFFSRENLKLQQQIYFNEPYTKITRLELDERFFKSGEKICSLTGEKYQKLETLQNVSPFIANLNTFNSFFMEDTKPQISWKVKYLVHFSPKLCLYKYSNKIYESLLIYFFDSTNLKNLLDLYEINKSFYKTSIELEENNYLENYNLFEIKDFFTEQYENLFAIIYTFYLQFLKTQNLETNNNLDDPFAKSKFEKIPISLVSFRANKFSKTMRPDSYDEINNFKFIVRVIHYLETKGIRFDIILYNLKIISVSQKNTKNHFCIERQLRNRVLEKFIKSKSILTDMEWLFFQSFKYLFDKNYYENRNYNALIDFVKYYEQIIKYGGNKSMNPELQEKAIKLGTSIGMGILLFENEDNKTDKKKENIKKARKYIIGIRKAGNFEKFADALIRIQERFLLSVSKELLQQINNDNFSYIQKFIIISMLNHVNPIIRNHKEKNKNQ